MISFSNFIFLTLIVTNVFGLEQFQRFHINNNIATRIVLRCPVMLSDEDSVSYYQLKENGELAPLKHDLLLKDSFTLDIIPESKSGHYQCHVIHKADGSKTIVDYYIDRKGLYKDIQKLKYSSTATSVKEIKLGESISLKCQVEGATSTNYLWFGPDLLQLNNTQIDLDITSSKRENFGEYFCGRIEDVKNSELLVNKFVVKLQSTLYETNIKKSAKSLLYPTYKLGEQVIYHPPSAYTYTRRLIWEYPPETVLLKQGRKFIRQIFTHDMTQEEFYYRESDRIDLSHIAAKKVLFQSQEMGSQLFNVVINPTPARVIIGYPIEIFCNNTNNLKASWYYKNPVTTSLDDLPAGVETSVEGPFTIINITVSKFSHSGVYVCDAKKGAVEVVLTVAPEPKLTVSPTEVVIRPGTSARFLCQLIDATGTVLWRRKDRKSFQMNVETRIGGDTQSILVVQSVPKEMNGSIYECIHNTLVKEMVAEVSLLVRDICPPNKRSCNNGECIDESNFCNGMKDCADASDEDISTCAQCEPNQQACMIVNDKKPLQKCVVKHWYCDGDNDCGNGYDELNCAKINKDTCLSTHFACNDNQTLIPRSLWCDKSSNCPNGDDEINCRDPEVVLPSKETTYVIHTNTSVSLLCEVVSVPTSTVNWRYNWGALPKKLNFTITQTGTDCNRIRNVLTIHNMHPDFAGVYTCEAISSARAMAKDYTIFVTSQLLCQRPYFNNAAWLKDMCLKCYCSNVTNDCTSATGYYQSPTLRVSTHSRAYLMNFISKRIMETGNSKSLFDPETKIYKFYDKLYSSFVINPNMYLTSHFGLSGSWLESYSYYMTVHFKVTGKQVEDIRGPTVIIKGTNDKSLHWCRSENSPVIYTAVDGYLNSLQLTLWEKENWFNNIACSSSATREDMLNVLSDVAIILVRIKYDTNQTGFEFHNITLEHAIPATKSGEAGVLVPKVEQCNCPFPYAGLSCEKCVDGYHKNAKRICVKKCPMNCDECQEGGECIKCKGHRTGPQCLQCRAGYTRSLYKNMMEDCEECSCTDQSNNTMTVNDCSRAVSRDGKIHCKCTGKEVNDPSCNKCLRTPLSPELERSCKNQTTSENENCNKYGTGEIINKMCKCKLGYSGEFCTKCEPGYFEHDKKCLKCFCSNATNQCQASTEYKFVNLTLNSEDFKLDVKLTNRFLSGVYDAETNVGDLKVNRTSDKIIIKKNPSGKGLVYVTINVKDTANPDSINTYTMLYGGKITLKFEYLSDSLDSLLFHDVTPFLEIESKKFGQLWIPFTYNEEKKVIEAKFSEDCFPSWTVANDGSVANREMLIRALMTAQHVSIAFPFNNDIAKKVRISQLRIEHARKQMESGKVAPVEICTCPSDMSGVKCEACAKSGFNSVMSLSPNAPDFVCGQCNTRSCVKCPDGSYNYDFLLNKNFSSCQLGIEIQTKGRVIKAHRGESLSIPCNVKSYRNSVAIHKWSKTDSDTPLETIRHLSSDDQSKLVLNFKELKLSDSGFYTCTAQNAISKGSEQFYIEVIDKPPRLRVDIDVVTEPKHKIQFNVSIVSPHTPTDYKVIWSVVKDGKTSTEESYKVQVSREKTHYKIDVEVTSNATDGVQLRGLVVGSRVDNPFFYEIRQVIRRNVSIHAQQLKLSTDKDILHLKFLEAGIIKVQTSPNIRTETFWYKISANGTEIPLPDGITRRGNELIVWSGSENHNGRYVGYVINTDDGTRIGTVHTSIKVTPMEPDVKREMFNMSQTDNMSVNLYIPLTIYCPNQSWELHNTKSGAVIDITKNVTRISHKKVIISYPLTLGDIVRFRCFVIPDAHQTGEITISLESKYPILEIIPKYETSIYPVTLKCIDNNTAYSSNITWYFNDKTIGNQSFIDWRNFGNFQPHLHEGMYTCYAINYHYNASKSVLMPGKRQGRTDGYIRIVSTTNTVKKENDTLRIYILAGQRLQIGAVIVGFPPLGAKIQWFHNNVSIQPTSTKKYESNLEIKATTTKEHAGWYRVQLELSNGTVISKEFEVVAHKDSQYYAKVDGLDSNGDLSILEGDSRVIGCKLIRKEKDKDYEESNVKIEWKFVDSLGGTPAISDIQGLKMTSDYRAIDISNARKTLNKYRGQCVVTYNGETYSSKYFVFDVNQRNIDPKVRLIGLEENKYVVNEEDSTSQVICQAYDENSKRILPNAEYKWEMTFSSQNKKINWKKMIINDNKITFGGLISHKVANSAVGRCRVNYFNTILYSDEFSFKIKKSEAHLKRPKIKIIVTYDPKKPPYPTSVSCRDVRVNITSNISLTVSNPNFDNSIVMTKDGWLFVNFTSNGTAFDPYRHSGKYIFTITNQYGSKSKEILLPQYNNPNKNYSANIDIYSTTGEIKNDQIRVKSQSELKMICVYNGHPYPISLKWTLKGMQHSNAMIESLDYWTSLTIKQFNSDINGGEYECMAQSHQGILNKKVTVVGYGDGLRVEILDEKGNKMPGTKNLQQGENFVIRSRAIDLSTNSEIKNINGTWEFRFSKTDNFTVVTPSTFTKEEVVFKGSEMKIVEIARAGRLEIRCKFQSKGSVYVSESVVVNVKENIKLHPEPHFFITHAPETIYLTELKCVDTSLAPSTLVLSKIKGYPNKEVEYTTKSKESIAAWIKKPFSPYYDLGTYQCVAQGKFQNKTIFINLPEENDRVLPTYVEFESRVNEITVKDKTKSLVVIDGNKFLIICNYYGSRAPITDVEIILESTSGESKPPANFASSFQTKSYYSEINVDKFDMTKHSGTYTCRSRNRTHFLVDKLIVKGIKAGYQVVVKGLDVDNNVKLMLGSTRNFTCTVIDAVTKKTIDGFKYDWKLETHKGVVFDVDDLSEIVKKKDGDITLGTVKTTEDLRGRCEASSKNGTFYSSYFELTMTQDKMKKPKLSFFERSGSEERGFPTSLICLDETKNGSEIKITRLSGDPPDIKLVPFKNTMELKFPAEISNPLLYIGSYRCDATNKFGSDFKVIDVTYTRKAKQLSVAIKSTENSIAMKTIEMSINKRLELDCIYSGDSQPIATEWVLIKDSSVINLEKDRKVDGFLMYQKKSNILSVVHDGFDNKTTVALKCRAKDNNGTVESDSVVVKVIVVGTKIVISGLDNSTAASGTQGSEKVLKCKVFDLTTEKDISKNFTILWVFTDENGQKIELNQLAVDVKTKNEQLTLSTLKGLNRTLYGHCNVNNGTNTYNSTKFVYVTKEDDSKKPKISFQPLVVPNRRFPTRLDCITERDADIVISRFDGKPIPKEFLEAKERTLLLNFPTAEKDLPPFEGGYQCSATNIYGSDRAHLTVGLRELLSVTFNSSINRIVADEFGNLSTIVRKNRKLELNCYVTGTPTPEVKLNIITEGYRPDLPVPERKVELVPRDRNSQYQVEVVNSKHYRLTREYYSQSPPSSFSCDATSDGRTVSSQVKVQEVSDIYKINIISYQQNQLNQIAFLDKPFTIGCEIKDADNKLVKMHSIKWIFKRQRNEIIDIKKLAKTVTEKGNSLTFDGLTLNYGNLIRGQCVVFSNETYDTLSDEFNVNIKASPEITRLYVELKVQSTKSEFDFPLNFTYDALNTTEFTCKANITGDAKPLISWIKCSDATCNSSQPLDSGNALIFFEDSTKYTDAGEYRCVVKLSVDNTLIAEQIGSVFIRRKGVPKKHPTQKTSSKNSVTLTCDYTNSSPEGNLTWSFRPEGKEGIESVPITSTIKTQNQISRLTINKPLKPEYSGAYICTISNQYGVGGRQFNVTIINNFRQRMM